MKKQMICGIAAAGMVLSACTVAVSAQRHRHANRVHHESSGLASFYERPQMTASGEMFSPAAFTAAHRTLPLGSRVRVTNVKTGKSVSVRINDRGPYVAGRVIDLSRSAAQAIGLNKQGVAAVKVERIARR